MVTKLNKGVKDYSYKERLEELKLISLQEKRMRGDLMEFQNFGRYFFHNSHRTGNLPSTQISKTKSTDQLYIFFCK